MARQAADELIADFLLRYYRQPTRLRAEARWAARARHRRAQCVASRRDTGSAPRSIPDRGAAREAGVRAAVARVDDHACRRLRLEAPEVCRVFWADRGIGSHYRSLGLVGNGR